MATVALEVDETRRMIRQSCLLKERPVTNSFNRPPETGAEAARQREVAVEKYRKFMQRAIRKDDGAVATEYAFLVVFVAIAGAFGMAVLGDDLASSFHDIGTSINEMTEAAVSLFDCGNEGGGDGTGGGGGSGLGGGNTC